MSRKRPSPSHLRSASASMSTFPVLPKITGEIILETFSHKSLRSEGNGSCDESGDNQRLSELGNKVVDLAVTNSLYHKTPLVKAEDIPDERDKILSEENIEKWVEQYRLRDKIRVAPDVRSTIRSAEETRALFCAYVGAVFLQSGMKVITEWIGRLIDSNNIPPEPEGVDPTAINLDHDDRQNKRMKAEHYSPEIPPPPTPSGSTASMYAPPVTYVQPSMTPVSPTMPTNAVNPPQSSVVFLPLFNQTCAQKKITVDYQAEFHGPSHAGRWNIKCVVNGIVKGQGQGISKQLAKEEAAKQAYYAMGFSSYAT